MGSWDHCVADHSREGDSKETCLSAGHKSSEGPKVPLPLVLARFYAGTL